MKLKHLFSIVCLMFLTANLHVNASNDNVKNLNNYEQSFGIIAESLNVETLEVESDDVCNACYWYHTNPFTGGDLQTTIFKKNGKWYSQVHEFDLQGGSMTELPVEISSASALMQCIMYDPPKNGLSGYDCQ